MQETSDIVELGDMLARLRAADTSFRVFGSKQHRYRLGQTLSESELAAFESANRIRLPDDYRWFLAAVGNGGAGPFYGVEPLSTFDRDLSQPFRITTATDALALEDLERLGERNEYAGILEFCHHGCAIYPTWSAMARPTAPFGTAARSSIRPGWRSGSGIGAGNLAKGPPCSPLSARILTTCASHFPARGSGDACAAAAPP